MAMKMEKKLILIVERWIPSFGGAEGILAQVGKKFSQQGVSLYIIGQNFEATGFPYHPLPISLPRKPRSLHAFLFAYQANQILKRFPHTPSLSVARVPHAHIYQPHGGVLQRNLQATYKLGNPWLRAMGKLMSPKIWAFLELERRIFHSSHTQFFIALSKRVEEDMVRYYSIEREKCPILYNGVNTKIFNKEKREEYQNQLAKTAGIQLKKGTKMILFVAHNFTLKGLEWALRGIEKIHKKRIYPLQFWIIGRGKKKFYFNLAKSLGIHKIVHFLGEQKNMSLWYSLAHILLHPTFYDPCSLVCLEALASGVPVITTQHNGVSEIMQESGMVLSEPWQTEEMAKGMVEILSHWETYSEKAFTIGQQFSLENHFLKLYSIYQKVLSSCC